MVTLLFHGDLMTLLDQNPLQIVPDARVILDQQDFRCVAQAVTSGNTTEKVVP